MMRRAHDSVRKQLPLAVGQLWRAIAGTNGDIAVSSGILLTFIQLFALYVVLSVLYRSTTSSAASFAAIAGAIAAIVIASWSFRDPIRAFFRAVGDSVSAVPLGMFLTVSIFLGIVLRLAWVLLFPAEPTSDFATTVAMSMQLLDSGTFGGAEGRAYFGPGLSFFIAPFVIAFGAHSATFLLINVGLFVATIVACAALASRIAGPISARASAALLSVWPGWIFFSGLPSKELVLALLLPLALVLYLGPVERHATRVLTIVKSGLAGVVLGCAALFQPSVILLPGIFFVFELLRADTAPLRLQRLTALSLGFAACVLPWTARNYVVLDAFVPISTAGGVNFYMANHPQGTGGWTQVAIDELNALGLPEVEKSAYGFRKGLEFIVEDPIRFAGTVLQRHTRLLGEDREGAHWTLVRGLTGQETAYTVAVVIGNTFWIAAMIVMFLSASRIRGSRNLRSDALLICCLAAAYPLVIHSFFESQSRHHVMIVGILAIFISLGCEAPNRRAADATQS